MTVLVSGAVGGSTLPLLRAVLDGVYARRPDVVVLDLYDVTCFDSSALATLVAARRRLATQHAVLSIRRPSSAAARTLRTSGLARVLDLD